MARSGPLHLGHALLWMPAGPAQLHLPQRFLMSFAETLGLNTKARTRPTITIPTMIRIIVLSVIPAKIT